jgi:hypothetical protein
MVTIGLIGGQTGHVLGARQQVCEAILLLIAGAMQ